MTVPFVRDKKGHWSIQCESEDEIATLQKWQPDFKEAVPRYMTALDLAFTKAKEKNEFEFILCLLQISGMDSAGWDPRPTIRLVFKAAFGAHRSAADFITQRFIELSLYQHIVEAAFQYDLISNLLSVSAGGHFNPQCFPPNEEGEELSPGRKITYIVKQAKQAGLRAVAKPFEEFWRASVRNAFAHANYVWYGTEFRCVKERESFPGHKISKYSNKSYAFFEALEKLYSLNVSSYKDSKRIEVKSSGWPKYATVIVRDGFGVVGLKDAFSKEELANGAMPFRVGWFTSEEDDMLDRESDLAFLPKRDD